LSVAKLSKTTIAAFAPDGLATQAAGARFILHLWHGWPEPAPASHVPVRAAERPHCCARVGALAGWQRFA